MKLIAFINPEKFKDLFNDSRILNSIGYTKQVTKFVGSKSVYLGNSDILAVSSKKLSIIEIKDINISEEKIFLIPDSKIEQVKDLCFPYKVLFHSGTQQTNFATDLKRLTDKSFGFKLSYEDENTIYYDLVAAITSIHNKREVNLNLIDSKIKTTDLIQESKIKLIEQVKNFNVPDKVVDELKEFQSALDDFKKFKEYDFLSTEYTNAFSKFRDNLNMEA